MTETPADGLPPAPALTRRPQALLLDFGGVVFATRRRADGLREVADRVSETLARAGHHLPAAELLPVLAGGRTALRDWKNAASRRLAPRELTHREIWGDFLAAPLPAAPREVLVGDAGALQQMVTLTLAEHTPRPGIAELVELAAALDVPLGIVSNAHSGRAHRTILERHGLADAFGVQVYSDEVGVRKPNPEMIEIAARALGADPARCWYVGDTYDRDVVAGRRAGVAAVIVTRHRHTDEVPFPVADVPDAVFDTPEGLVRALRAAGPPGPAPEAGTPEGGVSDGTAPGRGARDTGAPATGRAHAPGGVPGGSPASALLLDHGGVISVSRPDAGVRRAFAELLAARLTRAGYPLDPDRALAALDEIRGAHAAWKARHELPPAAAPTAVPPTVVPRTAAPTAVPRTAVPPTDAARTDAATTHAGAAHPTDPGPAVPEIDARTFWVDLAAPVLERLLDGDRGTGLRAWLRAEAHALMVAYARAKSVPTVRPGVRELLRAAHDAGVPVAVVSNTVNGRAVREKLDAAGLSPFVGAHVYSDELGHRKPDPRMPATALRALGADPARAWFVGDKPSRDVRAARAAGVGHVVLVRGGSTPDEVLDAATPGDPTRPDHLVDDMTGLAALIGLTPVTPPDSGRPRTGREPDPVPGS